MASVEKNHSIVRVAVCPHVILFLQMPARSCKCLQQIQAMAEWQADAARVPVGHIESKIGRRWWRPPCRSTEGGKSGGWM